MIFRKTLEEGKKEGVHFVNGSIAFQSVKLNVYSYVVDGIAIDAGAQSLAGKFKRFYEGKTIDAVYCTHIHEDHTGCASWFREKNIPVYLPSLSLQEAAVKGKYPMYRKLFWGRRRAFTAAPVPEEFNSRKDCWRSIYTPGHSYDHTVYLNTSKGQLFSGDLFVHVRTKVILENESIPKIIKSIEKVLAYDYAEIFCNHAGYIKDGKKVLKQKLEYLQALTSKVDALQRKGMNSQEIHRQLFPKQYPITLLSGGEWDSKHIVRSILDGVV